MCTKLNNMTMIEAMIRFNIAIFLIVFALHYGSALLLVLPIIIIYTAITKRCFIYSIFKINSNIINDNYYKSISHINIPAYIFIFNEDGKMVFKNEINNESLQNINYINDLAMPKNIKYELLEEKKTCSFIYKISDYDIYNVNMVNLQNEKITIAYLFDIN